MRLCRLSILLFGLAVAGCDDRPPSGSIPVYPVNGQLVYKGKPLADALVTFHTASASEPGSIKPTGRTDADAISSSIAMSATTVRPPVITGSRSRLPIRPRVEM